MSESNCNCCCCAYLSPPWWVTMGYVPPGGRPGAMVDPSLYQDPSQQPPPTDTPPDPAADPGSPDQPPPKGFFGKGGAVLKQFWDNEKNALVNMTSNIGSTAKTVTTDLKNKHPAQGATDLVTGFVHVFEKHHL